MNSTSIKFRDRLSCTIPEACAAMGIGRTTLYSEISAGRVKVRKFGTRTVVVVDSLIRLIDPDENSVAAAEVQN